MYDLIGDIHGHAATLEQLLTKLGYTSKHGIWQHSSRKIIFVGDYIDRGPQIKETLALVKGMVDAGNAIALMGNHEYNAVAYHTPDGKGGFLRDHNLMHNRQHQATLDQFKDEPELWKLYLQWFFTLKLFLDLPELRAVHACWNAEHIHWLKERDHLTLSPELLFASCVKSSPEKKVIDETLKGKEFNIPEEFMWFDKDGHARTANRVKWWKQPGDATYGEFLFSCPPELENEPVPADVNIKIYPATAPPVFFGHYWLEDDFPVIQAANVICLDYSVAKNGPLVAYRFNGEQRVDNNNFVFVEGTG